MAVHGDIHPNGYWFDLGPGSECHKHHFDLPLSQAVLAVFQNSAAALNRPLRVLDLGCGNGSYTKFFRDNGVEATGYDGNPNASTYPHCHVLDLSQSAELPVADWVLSLEVAEHIPAQFESNFIGNLHRHNTMGIVLSWATPDFNGGNCGHGHVNMQRNGYVKERMKAIGYASDEEAERICRDAAAASWFKFSTMVFRR